jgi:LacI family transcriptional regulator
MTMTLKDLGRLAGVHPSTVARVLNGEPRQRVSEEVRTRILELAREHGYQPNYLARSLRMKRSFVIGTAIPDIANPFFAMLFRGIEDALADSGYSAIMTNTDDDPAREQRSITMLHGRQVDGLLIATARREDPTIEALQEAEFPFVLVNRHTDPIPANAVVPDDYAGAAAAVDHLVALGHRRIAHIAGSDEMSTGYTRHLGYLETIQRHHLPVDPDLVVRGSFREPGGYEAMRRLLDLLQPPTAVFAVNDLAAIGAIRAIEDASLRVPRDISIVGFNDLSAAIGTVRMLTTVRLPLHDMGVAAAKRLLAHITSGTVSPEPLVIPIELVVRQSTAPAPS